MRNIRFNINVSRIIRMSHTIITFTTQPKRGVGRWADIGLSYTMLAQRQPNIEPTPRACWVVTSLELAQRVDFHGKIITI